MAERPVRRPRKPHTAEVVRTERLTPHMQRVVLGGEGLAAFTAGTSTDHYVKLLFPAEGVEYPEPFDLERIREEFPREQWPVTRTYTVRSWNPELRELALDFVIHGDEGLAGPWAARARPGDVVRFNGPGGGYAPDVEADWHLLAGDESALPAIAAALESLPADAVVRAFVEVAGPEEEQKFDSGVEVVWLHRGERPVGGPLVDAVRGLAFPRDGCTPSSTARPASSRSCAPCCGWSARSRGRTCRSPATGASATTRTAGSPPSASGTPRSRPSRRAPPPDGPSGGRREGRSAPRPADRRTGRPMLRPVASYRPPYAYRARRTAYRPPRAAGRAPRAVERAPKVLRVPPGADAAKPVE